MFVRNAGGRPVGTLTVTELRECRHHGVTPFHRYSAGTRNEHWRCKRCVGDAVTRRHRKVKAMLAAEAGGACAVCGYNRCIANLHFHHVDPATKSFKMSCSSGKAIATYREEMKKCVLVCANCHGEIEMSVIPSPPAGAVFVGLP